MIRITEKSTRPWYSCHDEKRTQGSFNNDRHNPLHPQYRNRPPYQKCKQGLLTAKGIGETIKKFLER